MQVENGVIGCSGLLTAACDALVLIALCIVQVWALCGHCPGLLKRHEHQGFCTDCIIMTLKITYIAKVKLQAYFEYLIMPVNEQVGAPAALSGLVPLAIVMPCNLLLLRVSATHQEAAAKLRM